MTTKTSPLQGTMTGRFDVSKGPGELDLMLGVFRNTFFKPLYTEFWIDIDKLISIPVEISLNGVQKESGSGYQWLIEGFNPHSGQEVHGYYNQHDRSGWIEFHSKTTPK